MVEINNPEFGGVVLITYLTIMILLIIGNHIAVVFEQICRTSTILFGLLVIQHNYTWYYQLVSVLLIVALLFLLFVKDNMIIKRSGEVKPFSSDTFTFKMVQYFDLFFSPNFYTLLDRVLSFTKKWLPTIGLIIFFSCLAIFILDLQEIRWIHYTLICLIGTLLSVLRWLDTLVQLNEHTYTLVVKHELACCQIQRFRKVVQKTILIGTGGAVAKEYLPKTCDQVDEGVKETLRIGGKKLQKATNWFEPDKPTSPKKW
jgi:hypothetical protein